MTKLNKIIFLILTCLILILGSIIIYNSFKPKNHLKTFNYFNTNIIIEINTKDSEKTFDKIEEILKKYNELTDTKQEYNNIINLYKIHKNFIKDETLTIDKELYNLIKYGIELYNETDGLIDISKGNLVDLWDSYITTKIGFPSNIELTMANNQSIDDIVLLDNNKIKNNKVNINLDYIVKAYALSIVQEYLKEEKIDSYSVNMDDIVIVENQSKNYKIGLKDPDNNSSVLKVIEVKSKTISTTSYKDKYYNYEGKIYNNIINPKKLYPTNEVKSVYVIMEDIKTANYLSKILFTLDIEEGRELIKDINDIQVIWYTMDNEIIEFKN